jgi:hypothetical protein
MYAQFGSYKNIYILYKGTTKNCVQMRHDGKVYKVILGPTTRLRY